MEKFVFDVFRFADSDKFAVWECVREDEFAPLKNAEGASDFTPTHCRNALYALHQKLLLAAGANLVDADGCTAPLMVSPAAAKDSNNNNNNNNEDDKSPGVNNIKRFSSSSLRKGRNHLNCFVYDSSHTRKY
jgi:hypothetical protein